jgi:hypothetical protein
LKRLGPLLESGNSQRQTVATQPDSVQSAGIDRPSILLRRVRLACWISAGFVLVPFSQEVSFGEGLAWLMCFPMWLIVAGPYLAILRKLRAGPAEEDLRWAAGIAGASFFGVGATLLFVLVEPPSWATQMLLHHPRFRWQIAVILVALLMQAWLFWNAQRMRHILPSSGSTVSSLLYGAVLAGYFFIAAALVLPGSRVIGKSTIRNDASVRLELRTLQEAASSYRATYRNGFPAGMTALGPSPDGRKPNCHFAGLVDGFLAGGTKSGYVFEYSPGPALASSPADCPLGSQSFVVAARPAFYGTTGVRSFLMDETGVIRWTAEDRPARPSDPSID